MPAFLKWLAMAVHLDWCRLFSIFSVLPTKNGEVATQRQYACYPKSKIAKTRGAITLIADPEQVCQGRGNG